MPTRFMLTDSLAAEYQTMFANCQIVKHKDQVEAARATIMAHKGQYDAVSAQTQVPWYVVAAIHCLEAGLNFNKHLHNGDPLSARTVHVPSGRPKTGTPPFSWPASAIDALTLDGLAGQSDWDLAPTLYRLERYNGSGYRVQNPPIPSPYLWSYSQYYTAGKYGADGHYDPKLVSQQAGAAVLLHLMQYEGLIHIPV